MTDPAPDLRWMARALDQARLAVARREVPVGAVVVRDDLCLAEAFNEPISRRDPTAHAEIVALRAAATALDEPRLPGCTVYVTLEPCLMCLGAMLHARIQRLVYAAPDAKLGATRWVDSLPLGPAGLNHKLKIEQGPLAEESARLLREFFADRR